MGRCPSCKAVIRIPGPADGADDNVSQRAPGPSGLVPPPPRTLPPSLPEYRVEQDDIEIPEDPSGETDVIPSEEVIDASEAKRRRRAAREARRGEAQARAQAAVTPLRRRHSLLRLIVLIGIGVALLAVAIASIFVFSGKH